MLGTVVTGSGRDLVLLHGWGMNAGVWKEVAKQLSARFRVHAVDLPGYGASTECAPYTLAQMAMELAHAMPPHCMVCGWSLGGQLALEWAVAAPLQVERLALVATTPCFVRRADWPHAMAGEVLEDFARALAADHEGTIRRFLALQVLGDGQARQVLAQLNDSLRARGRPQSGVLEQGLRILRDTDLRARLGSITQPVMVIHGDRDTLVPLAAASHLSHSLPRARLEVLRGAAHAPFVANARAFGADLAGFFDE
jgi:pimeloyl-[acyl-carrier protein] methyl ester esterase